MNEAVVVKGREYQGNVFGGFRRSTILGYYDNRGGTRPSLSSSSSRPRRRGRWGRDGDVKAKGKERAPMRWGYILCMPVRDASPCCKSVTCNVNTLCDSSQNSSGPLSQ